MKKYLLLGVIIVMLALASTYLIFFYHPKKNGYYFILERDGKKLYADEKNPKMESNGEVVFIKEFLPKSNCMLSCIYHYAAMPFKETDKAYIFAYQINNTTYYYSSCKNEREVFISKEIADFNCD